MNGTISIARAGQELGAWDAADIEKMLQAGVLTPADHFWQEGMTEWTTLASFVPPQETTMIFPVTFGSAWSVDKLGFVGKGELHLMADAIELVGRRHWSRLARFGVFVIAAPLGWFLFGSITGSLRADTDAARFWWFCATLLTVLGVPLLVLTLMHYFCVFRAKMHWPRAMVSNVRRSSKVITFEVPVAESSRPRKVIVCAADEATAEVIVHALPGSMISAMPAASRIAAPAGSAVPSTLDPPLPIKPHRHLLTRSLACLADALLSLGGPFLVMFGAIALSPSQRPFSERSLSDGFGGNAVLAQFVAAMAFAAGSAYFLFRDGLPRGSFGKRLFGLSVVDCQQGSRCSYWKSFVRNLVVLILYVVAVSVRALTALFYVEVLCFLFLPNGRRLGDRLAGTQVIKRQSAIAHAHGPLRPDHARGEEMGEPVGALTSTLPDNGPGATTVRVFDGNIHLHGSNEAERLTTLNSLYEQGLISDEMFEAKQRQILQEL